MISKLAWAAQQYPISKTVNKKKKMWGVGSSLSTVAHAFNPNYPGGRDQEDSS
jgi:hypothetical protein